MVRVLGEYGYGGALHVEAGDASLKACRFNGNTALMVSAADSLDASAGGISIGAKSRLSIADCVFVSSHAGGVGRQETAKSPLSAQLLGTRASHVLCQGIASIQNCTFTLQLSVQQPNSAPWGIVALGTGSVVVADSMLQSSEPNMGALRVAENGQALLRNCIGMNVTIDPSVAEGKLGIVDSQFLPPLPAGVKTLQPLTAMKVLPTSACATREPHARVGRAAEWSAVARARGSSRLPACATTAVAVRQSSRLSRMWPPPRCGSA
jgi:hypothetical protein